MKGKKRSNPIISFIVIYSLVTLFFITIVTSDESQGGVTKAVLEISPQRVAVGKTVVFDASHSTTESGGKLVYSMSFGDLDNKNFQDSPRFAHRYQTVGTYEVTLHISNSCGNGSDSCFATVEVYSEENPSSDGEQPQMPSAVLDIYPQRINIGGTVIFDASRSTRGSGGQLSYRWEINKYITTQEQSSPFFMHTKYDSSFQTGVYDITLYVSNSAGKSSCHSSLYVSSEYYPPYAVLDIQNVLDSSWNPSLKRVGIEKQVTFDASQSSPGNGNSLQYKMSFDGCSSFTEWQESSMFTHVFSDYDEYECVLYVKNDVGASLSHYTISVSPEYDTPVGSLEISPKIVDVGESVRFDASKSNPLYGGNLSYRMSFDGENIYTAWQDNPVFTDSFQSSGTHQVNLYVRNNLGYDYSCSGMVYVRLDKPSTILLAENSTDELEIFESIDTVTFSGSGSLNVDFTSDNLEYNFFFGDETSSGWQKSPFVTKVYTSPGVFEAYLITRGFNSIESERSAQIRITVKKTVISLLDTPEGTWGDVNQSFKFDSIRSCDKNLNNHIIKYTIAYGDGTTEESTVPTTFIHQYTKDGVFVATLTVTNNMGEKDSSSSEMVIGSARDVKNIINGLFTICGVGIVLVIIIFGLLFVFRLGGSGSPSRMVRPNIPPMVQRGNILPDFRNSYVDATWVTEHFRRMYGKLVHVRGHKRRYR